MRWALRKLPALRTLVLSGMLATSVRKEPSAHLGASPVAVSAFAGQPYSVQAYSLTAPGTASSWRCNASRAPLIPDAAYRCLPCLALPALFGSAALRVHVKAAYAWLVSAITGLPQAGNALAPDKGPCRLVVPDPAWSLVCCPAVVGAPASLGASPRTVAPAGLACGLCLLGQQLPFPAPACCPEHPE